MVKKYCMFMCVKRKKSITLISMWFLKSSSKSKRGKKIKELHIPKSRKLLIKEHNENEDFWNNLKKKMIIMVQSSKTNEKMKMKLIYCYV